MPLPPANTIQVATKATAHYLARLAASRAGGPLVDFTEGTVILGDGDGDVPPIDDLVTVGGVINEVARGSWVQGVNVNDDDEAQTDVLVVVPTVDGAGNEIGPFWVTEYGITDENGDVCLVGTTIVPKLVTDNGGLTEVAFIAAEKESNGQVVITPPSAAFATIYDIIIRINANHVDVTAPLQKTDTMQPSGMLRRVISLPAASPPAEAPDTVDATNIGYGRPATDLEFEAGESLGGFAHPWPTLEQIDGLRDLLLSADPTRTKDYALAAPQDVANATLTRIAIAGANVSWATIAGGLITIAATGIYAIGASSTHRATAPNGIPSTSRLSISVNGVEKAYSADSQDGNGQPKLGSVAVQHTRRLAVGDTVAVNAYIGNDVTPAAACRVNDCLATLTKLS